MTTLIERLRLGEGTSPDHFLLLEAADALEKLETERCRCGFYSAQAGDIEVAGSLTADVGKRGGGPK
jgi:hypothetical protein